jgi:FkbM family methyltransferase
MNFTNRLIIKTKSLKDYYIFQKGGIPQKKNEHISKSILKKYLPQMPVIIDCGAHDGADSIELARILKGQIHSFEPVKEIFTRLKKKTEPFSNIHCYNLALSDQTGIQHFYVSEGVSDASSSLLEPQDHLLDHPDTYFNKKIEVEALTLDEWARRNNIAKVDLLWLDMQGFELNMLKASDTVLKTVSLIHTEVSTKETYKGVSVYSDYRKFLESKGFSVIMEAIPTGWDMGNVLFQRR